MVFACCAICSRYAAHSICMCAILARKVAIVTDWAPSRSVATRAIARGAPLGRTGRVLRLLSVGRAYQLEVAGAEAIALDPVRA